MGEWGVCGGGGGRVSIHTCIHTEVANCYICVLNNRIQFFLKEKKSHSGRTEWLQKG